MQHLRSGIGLRGYGQRDPLVEYKREAYNLYHQLEADVQQQVANTIFKVSVAIKMPTEQTQQNVVMSGAAKTGDEQKTAQAMKDSVGMISVKNRNEYAGEKVGRNDDCPCGSGKKFKKCHGI